MENKNFIKQVTLTVVGFAVLVFLLILLISSQWGIIPASSLSIIDMTIGSLLYLPYMSLRLILGIILDPEISLSLAVFMYILIGVLWVFGGVILFRIVLSKEFSNRKIAILTYTNFVIWYLNLAELLSIILLVISGDFRFTL